jgi:hypothetical protein
MFAVRLGKIRVLNEIRRAQSAKVNDDPHLQIRSCRHSRVAGGTFGGFRRRGARSGDAVRRPDAPPRRARLRAAESVVDRGSLSRATDGFRIGGNSQHTTQVFAAMISHRTRSHGRGTHAESSQSPAPHTHVARVSAAPRSAPRKNNAHQVSTGRSPRPAIKAAGDIYATTYGSGLYLAYRTVFKYTASGVWSRAESARLLSGNSGHV